MITALRTLPKDLEKCPKEQKIRIGIEIILTTVGLSSAMILRRVPKSWEDFVSLKILFKLPYPTYLRLD